MAMGGEMVVILIAVICCTLFIASETGYLGSAVRSEVMTPRNKEERRSEATYHARDRNL